MKSCHPVLFVAIFKEGRRRNEIQTLKLIFLRMISGDHKCNFKMPLKSYAGSEITGLCVGGVYILFL